MLRDPPTLRAGLRSCALQASRGMPAVIHAGRGLDASGVVDAFCLFGLVGGRLIDGHSASMLSNRSGDRTFQPLTDPATAVNLASRDFHDTDGSV